jgi:hypothetical protein
MKISEIKTVTRYWSSNECHKCCVICENEECALCGEIKACELCRNHRCVNSGKYLCRYYCESGTCGNHHCVNHQEFNPREELAKYC